MMELKSLLVLTVVGLVYFQDGCHSMAPPPGLGRPYEKPNNMTMDEAILQTLGGVDVAANVMMEEGSHILAELDMYLSMDQFTNMYEPPQPDDMVKMGLMPAPIGVTADDPKYSQDIPPEFAMQEIMSHRRSQPRPKRKAASTAKPWEQATVPYLFANGHFSRFEEYMMRRSMTEWERYTCMTFRPATRSDSNSLRFQNGQGCNSQLGMRGGVQVLNLQAPGCRFKGLYLHEIGHALGLVHEHQLPDRDNYISILYNNVSPHMRIWFNKYADDELNRMQVKYELSSVMHYGITAFSKDGESQTIRARDPSQEERIGKVYLKELAYSDVEIVNKFYQCATHCPDQNKCGPNGHLDQNCNCICRDGSQDCDRTKQATDPSCRNNYYDWPCYIWANQGECERNAFYMERDCAKACGKCGRAQASSPGLGKVTWTWQWFPMFTNMFPADMLANEPECKDRYTQAKCKMWMDRGDCVTNRRWMKEHCGATCELCSDSRPQEMCTNTHSQPEKCDPWARDGECIVNRAFMFRECRKSCHMCTETGTGTGTGTDNGGGGDEDDMKCENTHNSCEDWASKGECTNNPNWMVPNCRKACGKCDDGTCKNLYMDVRCEIWAQKKECMANSKWMGIWCAKACGRGPCSGIDPGQTTAPSRTTRPPVGRTTTPGRVTARPTTPTGGNCVNGHDSDTQCDVWAKADHCDINPSWMLKHCARSCAIHANAGACGGGDKKTPTTTDSTGGKTNVCHDEDELCSNWAKGGYCDGDSSVYMLKNCKKSCNNCNGCRDAEFLCSVWAKADHCHQNPRYMLRHCQKSCQACTISRDQRPDGTIVNPQGGSGNDASSPRMGTKLIWATFVTVVLLLV